MSTAEPVRLFPLGGLGEVGMNCLVLEQQGRLLVVDCGTSFPGDDYGIDVVHPDFRWLAQNWSRVDGVFLTHGHEDHIGGLPHLFARGTLPIWGPAHALKLVRRRFADWGIELPERDLHVVRPRQRVLAGVFDVEPIRVSHSIVEATALCFTTPAGRIVHSGDFKFDPQPSDGEPTDEERLRELGDAGVELLLSDSTNVDSKGSAGSEADVAAALDEIIARAPRRVFVALFASNIQRLISLGRIAQRRGRKLCLLGRSLSTHIEVARELGHLDWPHNLLLPAERARTYPKDELLLLTTGTQGEPAAAAARLAYGTHRAIDVDPGDTFIFSSRVIPGCERPAGEVMAQLWRRGALVQSSHSAGVHTSGHANRDEQRQMLDLLRPRCFIPVHGTRHHLQRHAELAQLAGVKSTLVIENGQSAVLDAGRLRIGEMVAAGRVHVAYGGTIVPDDILERRHDLGRSGVVSVGLVQDGKGRLCVAPRLQAVGLPDMERSSALAELSDHLQRDWQVLQRDSERPASSVSSQRAPQSGQFREQPQRFLPAQPRFVTLQSAALEQQVERYVQRWADEHFGLRPLVLVHVLDNTALRE
jgi:ribonuclease J